MTANKIIFNSGTNVGQNGAENDDEFLFDCFVDHPAYSDICDLNTPTTFLLGSTGAGKTAILRMIKRQEERVEEIELHQLSMGYIANSDTVAFLKSLDVDLTLFFQALWRHVLCIEYIKLATNNPDKDQLMARVERFFEATEKQRLREKLEKFVREHEDQFWNTIDENVIEIADNLENKITGELGAEYKKFVAKAGYVHSLGSQQKIQLQQRARKFLDTETLAELPSVIQALSDYTRGRKDKFFLTIDGLDEHWVDDSIRFELLQALFECLKSLKKLRNFQPVVALRNDLYVRMIEETPTSQRQIEKYEDLIVRLRWSKKQLRNIADKRIQRMLRRQYSAENVHFDDIYKQKPDQRTAPWDYLVDRTLHRPRDVINFMNLTMQAADGKAAVSKTAFRTGEENYSGLRLETLIHEWSGTFPAVKIYLELLRDLPAYREASELMHSKLIDQFYAEMSKHESYHQDKSWALIEDYLKGTNELDSSKLAKLALSRLHLIGAIGLKLRPDRPWDWFHETAKPVAEEQISADTKLKVNPMLFSALSIRK